MGADYEKAAQLLAAHGVHSSAAEVHGMVCGQMSSGPGNLKTGVTAALLDLDEPPPVIEELLVRFANDVVEQQESGDFSFQPLLPDDDEELGARVHALGRWCEGFNAGFAAGFGKGDVHLSEETREVLGDFARIAEVEDRMEDAVAGQEQQEEDYAEIVEYVRMAASMVYIQHTLEGKQGDKPGDGAAIH